eukprot:1187681-Prorocentrum_minimum.AAC.3
MLPLAVALTRTVRNREAFTRATPRVRDSAWAVEAAARCERVGLDDMATVMRVVDNMLNRLTNRLQLFPYLLFIYGFGNGADMKQQSTWCGFQLARCHIGQLARERRGNSDLPLARFYLDQIPVQSSSCRISLVESNEVPRKPEGNGPEAQ